MKAKSNLFRIRIVYGLALAVLGLSLAPVTTAASNFTDANWSSMGGVPGVDGGVWATAIDGSGNLYIAGFFSRVGDVMANSIAKWNGNSWAPLGSGTEYDVMALAVSGSEIYAAGAFFTDGGVANQPARWDGNQWSPLGSGVGDTVRALAVSGSNVYAGGHFGIAKWDGTRWSPFGGINGSVYSLAVSGSDVYAGGGFTNASGVAANHIAKWDGSKWSALGSGMNGWVYSLAVSGSDLYVGGTFTIAGGVAATNIAKWDGSNWSALGSGIGQLGGNFYFGVSALAVSGSDVYAGGQFTNAGGVSANYIAKWDGRNWLALSSGMNGGVASLAVLGRAVYAGGFFTAAGGNAANGIAKWDESNWSALTSGSGIGGGGSFRNPPVAALTASGNNIYTGGSFTTAGRAEANGIAKWNGTNWSALGLGIRFARGDFPNIEHVSALAVLGDKLYAAGMFWEFMNRDGGVAAVRNIAQWDGSNWSALSSGLHLAESSCCPDVNALAVLGSDLFAAGYFTMAGGIPANNIAKWNGSSWSALGAGVWGSVSALAVSGSDLYVGGSFTTAGGVAATNIAKWNGSSWSALGAGIGVGEPSWAGVIALAVSGNDLYVGGNFITAGDSQASNIAKWDGNSWSALGSGLNGFVWALAVSGSDVYAGGRFTNAGGVAVNSIAKWNGSSWSALGSGVGPHSVSGPLCTRWQCLAATCMSEEISI